MDNQQLLYSLDRDVFPADYQSARVLWLSELSNLSGRVVHREYSCQGSGPHGEALITDLAWIGSENARRVVVVLAGTHGIEGFAGSAVHIDHLRSIGASRLALPDATALLLVHALTPWGYAWLRRCDAEGVDLNRNFIDFSGQLPKNFGYDQLKQSLWIFDAEERARLFAEFERLHGRVAFEQAISAGQYSDPYGPFYGGNHPAHGRLVIEDVLQRYALPERDLIVIDVHTGLGPYGYGEIICDHLPDSSGSVAARRYFGESVTLPFLGTSTSVPKTGLLDYSWHKIMNERSCYVTLEFGTYSTDRLFDILLKDHQLWAGSGGWAERMKHGRIMRRHFCPDDSAWQEMVLFRARQVIGQAFRAGDYGGQ